MGKRLFRNQLMRVRFPQTARVSFGKLLENWPSGLRHSPAKTEDPNRSRGFESHILRAVEAMHANKNIISEN